MVEMPREDVGRGGRRSQLSGAVLDEMTAALCARIIILIIHKYIYITIVTEDTSATAGVEQENNVKGKNLQQDNVIINFIYNDRVTAAVSATAVVELEIK